MRDIGVVALFVWFSVAVPAQVQSHASRSDQPSTPVMVKLTPESLITTGLSPNVKKIVTEAYIGDFHELNGDADATAKGDLITSYMKSYGAACPDYIPRDGVELTVSSCSMEQVTPGAFGPSGACVSYRQDGTGIFADRTLHSLAAGATLGIAGSIFGGNSHGRPTQLSTLFAIKAETPKLIALNGCSSPALRRYQDNLGRYLHKAKAIPLSDPAYHAPVAPPKSMVLPPSSEDYAERPYKPFPTVVVARIPLWIEEQRARVIPTLFPEDRDSFNRVVDRVKSELLAKDFDGVQRDGYMIGTEMENRYSARCFVDGRKKDESGCAGRQELNDMSAFISIRIVDRARRGEPIE